MTRLRSASTPLRIAVSAAFVAVASVALAQPNDGPLPSWNDGDAKRAIVGFVERVTQEGGPDFVPTEERIAVFDNDGTLWCEQPAYVQAAFISDRVRSLAGKHPEWKEKEPFRSLLAGDTRGVAATGEHGLAALVAATHSGLTTEEFDAVVKDWLKTTRHPKYDRPYSDLTYAPMVELLAYLRANGFKTYIASGGGGDFVRTFAERAYGIPPEQVIGSSGDMKYELRGEVPVLAKQPAIDFIDDKAGKPVAIHRHIGRRPVMAFGNSDGDYEMLRWTTAGDGPRFGLIVRHDDADREYAYDRDSHVGRLAKALDESPERGWVVVSMKKDWKAIFGEE